MLNSERLLIIILRVLSITALGAIPFVFVPHAWMDAIHDWVGLGSLPDTPITRYLTRSLSAVYAFIGTLVLAMSFDIRRYHGLLRLWMCGFVVMGVVLLGIDMASGMPLSWTLTEGPPAIVLGTILLRLQRRADRGNSPSGATDDV